MIKKHTKRRKKGKGVRMVNQCGRTLLVPYNEAMIKWVLNNKSSNGTL
jgi:hypothetical protein